MKIYRINPSSDMKKVERVANAAFSPTPDSRLDEWLSLSYMKYMIEEERGYGFLAENEKGDVQGVIYAQQENPVNGKEGEEKWVIIIAGVDPKYTGEGVGSGLLLELEKLARNHEVKKLFTFTNTDDEEVIHFYKKNGYEDAGWIKDYQYGKDNSAVFLLKHLT